MADKKRTQSPEQSAPFRLRGTTVNLVVLQLLDPQPAHIIPELERLLRQAPAFLHNAPIIIGLDAIRSASSDMDFQGLVDGLRNLDLFPIGVSGGKPSHQERAAAAGLPTLPKGSTRERDLSAADEAATARVTSAPPSEDPSNAKEAGAAPTKSREPPSPPPEEKVPDKPEPAVKTAPAPAAPAMLLASPVRAGQRVYADKGADLIITATVNPGAEVIADGNIHVYGALRGRAIAGAAGSEEARIFALRFEPELVAIAGLYRVREDLDTNLIGKGVQLRLDGEQLRCEPLDGRA